MNNNTKILLITTLLFITALFVMGNKSVEKFGTVSDLNPWSITTTVSSVSIGPLSSTRVVASSSARQYVLLSNSASQTIWCNLSDASSTANNGFLIAATSTYTINASNLYTGSIQCTNPVASSTLGVTAKQ